MAISEAAVETHKPKPVPGGVILVLALLHLLNYVDRGSLATAAPILQDELSFSATQLGILLSAFSWTYAGAQLLAGRFVHRFDIRVVLAVGLALWSVAMALTGIAGSFVSILLLRLLLGLGESVTTPGWQLVFARHLVEQERGRAIGLVTATQGFGPMLGTFVGGLVLAQFGWRAMFIALGLITLLWLWPWFRVTRGWKLDDASDHGALPVSYLEIIRRREFWGAAVGQFTNAYTFFFVLTWLPTFLVKAGGFTVAQMAGIGAAIYGIHGVATAVAGAVSDQWIRRGASATLVRKTFILTGTFGVAVSIACCAYVEPRAAILPLGAAAVCFGLASPMQWAIGTTLAGPRAAGRWAGAQNLASQIAGIIAPIATGLIVDQTGGFSWAFAVAAVVPLIALVAWGLIIRRVVPVDWTVAPVSEPVTAAAGAGMS
jgi:MFS family permease